MVTFSDIPSAPSVLLPWPWRSVFRSCGPAPDPDLDPGIMRDPVTTGDRVPSMSTSSFRARQAGDATHRGSNCTGLPDPDPDLDLNLDPALKGAEWEAAKRKRLSPTAPPLCEVPEAALKLPMSNVGEDDGSMPTAAEPSLPIGRNAPRCARGREPS